MTIGVAEAGVAATTAADAVVAAGARGRAGGVLTTTLSASSVTCAVRSTGGSALPIAGADAAPVRIAFVAGGATVATRGGGASRHVWATPAVAAASSSEPAIATPDPTALLRRVTGGAIATVTVRG